MCRSSRIDYSRCLSGDGEGGVGGQAGRCRDVGGGEKGVWSDRRRVVADIVGR